MTLFAADFAVRGVDLSPYVLALLALAYAVSVLRNWRPINVLRQENSDLRNVVKEQEERIRQMERRYSELEARYEVLERSRDFERPFEQAVDAIRRAHETGVLERAKMLDAFAAHDERESEVWREIMETLHALPEVLAAAFAQQRGEVAT